MMSALGRSGVLGLAAIVVAGVAAASADDPPELNPFGSAVNDRADTIPGYVELSDGTVRPGRVSLTREARLKIYDEQEKRFRDVPLRVVRRIDCAVQKEWVEREWRFTENASDEKVYTGKAYPAREYVHTITLDDGRSLRGPLSAIIYVQAEGATRPDRFLLHKRDKGPNGMGLPALTYVRSVRLGDEAFEEGRKRASKAPLAPKKSAVPGRAGPPKSSR